MNIKRWNDILRRIVPAEYCVSCEVQCMDARPDGGNLVITYRVWTSDKRLPEDQYGRAWSSGNMSETTEQVREAYKIPAIPGDETFEEGDQQ
jgi:hypothetical protein